MYVCLQSSQHFCAEGSRETDGHVGEAGGTEGMGLRGRRREGGLRGSVRVRVRVSESERASERARERERSASRDRAALALSW